MSGIGGAQGGVDGDPVAGELEPGRLGEGDVRDGADTQHDHVGVLGDSAGQLDGGDGAVAGEAGDFGAQPEVHSMVAMQGGEGAADLLADDGEQRLWQRVDHDHRCAVLAGRGRDLAADPAGADHEDVAPAMNRSRKGERVARSCAG